MTSRETDVINLSKNGSLSLFPLQEYMKVLINNRLACIVLDFGILVSKYVNVEH